MLSVAIFALAFAPALRDLEAIAPKLHALHRRAHEDPEPLARELAASPLAAIAPTFGAAERSPHTNGTLPIVTAHGMGDSCFNPGMKSITRYAGKYLGVYSVCIPTGGNFIQDTINGFLKNMDASVDEFARRARADPKLAHGFDAFGASQGNNLIRGYIAKVSWRFTPDSDHNSLPGLPAPVTA